MIGARSTYRLSTFANLHLPDRLLHETPRDTRCINMTRARVRARETDRAIEVSTRKGGVGATVEQMLDAPPQPLSPPREFSGNPRAKNQPAPINACAVSTAAVCLIRLQLTGGERKRKTEGALC